MSEKQAPMVMRSGLTATWYVVLRYKDLSNGRIEALDKRAVAEDSARDLEAFYSAYMDNAVRTR